MSLPNTRLKIPLTVMFIPRYEVTSSRREVTQKVEFEVELAPIGVVVLSMVGSGMVALSIGIVALSIGIVAFMVELATNGSVLSSAIVLPSHPEKRTHVLRQTSSLTKGYMPTISWISVPEISYLAKSELQAEEKFWAVESSRS